MFTIAYGKCREGKEERERERGYEEKRGNESSNFGEIHWRGKAGPKLTLSSWGSSQRERKRWQTGWSKCSDSDRGRQVIESRKEWSERRMKGWLFRKRQAAKTSSSKKVKLKLECVINVSVHLRLLLPSTPSYMPTQPFFPSFSNLFPILSFLPSYSLLYSLLLLLPWFYVTGLRVSWPVYIITCQSGTKQGKQLSPGQQLFYSFIFFFLLAFLLSSFSLSLLPFHLLLSQTVIIAMWEHVSTARLNVWFDGRTKKEEEYKWNKRRKWEGETRKTWVLELIGNERVQRRKGERERERKESLTGSIAWTYEWSEMFVDLEKYSYISPSFSFDIISGWQNWVKEETHKNWERWNERGMSDFQ